MKGFSPQLPLTIDPIDGYALTKTYKEVVSQNLKNLVLTSPGERMMIPGFGVGIRNFLFEQNTAITHQEILSRIQRQAARYMPFLRIHAAIISPYEGVEDISDLNEIKIEIRYTIKPLSIQDVLKISVG